MKGFGLRAGVVLVRASIHVAMQLCCAADMVKQAHPKTISPKPKP